MSTAGQDFFDQGFFDTQTVVLVDYPIEELKWYSDINQNFIDEWKLQNSVNEYEERLAKNMLNSWTSEILSLPFSGEHKIKHYFEKVLWLIQSYCEKGWMNPLKGINHLDNGQIVVHPGTNRCIAAKFLKCKNLKILINLHKEQHLLKKLKDSILINNESDLRNTLISSDKILWRTENTEELWINGQRQIGRFYPDFTYEFLGKDAWPEFDKFSLWLDTIGKMIPLNVITEKETIFESKLLGKTFKFNNQEFRYNKIKKAKKTHPYIYINRSLKDFDIFELLFFVSVNHRYSKTTDESIILYNPYALTNKELIIPDHYVNF